MKKYIGTKLIEAEPMNRGDYNKYRGWTIPQNEDPADAGYLIRYPDGYESWSPKELFDKAHLALDDNKELPSGVSVGPNMVDEFIAFTETKTMGNNTTVVRCVLRNGFVIVEASSCVDPENYSEEMGYDICMEKVRDKIWELLGFLLQTAWHGIL